MPVGTTLRGGDANNDGTAYGLNPKGDSGKGEALLYTFQGYPGDGSEPTGITISKQIDGTSPVFVSTVVGGTTNNGTVEAFSYRENHTFDHYFTYSFVGAPDGANPVGNPLVDKQGNIYGTTSAGGSQGAGAVYRMQPKGSSFSESILYSFQSGTDGNHPGAGLIADKKGALYGTTSGGGSTGSGTVFKLTPSGSGYTESVLYSFQGPPYDGRSPTSSVCGAANGTLYGTTEGGGRQNLGTVYKLTPSGSNYKESVLWNFGSVAGDGAYPYAGVIVDKNGVICGTTLEGGSGGSSGPGTIFILTPSASTYKESLYSFTGGNGANPYAGPSVDSKGNLYFTTGAGGKKGDGTVVKAAHPVTVPYPCSAKI